MNPVSQSPSEKWIIKHRFQLERRWNPNNLWRWIYCLRFWNCRSRSWGIGRRRHWTSLWIFCQSPGGKQTFQTGTCQTKQSSLGNLRWIERKPAKRSEAVFWNHEYEWQTFIFSDAPSWQVDIWQPIKIGIAANALASFSGKNILFLMANALASFSGKNILFWWLTR